MAGMNTAQSESIRGFALRDVLLLVQIVICTLLVTTSLVAVRGMQRALQVTLGFQPRGVMLAQTDLRMAGYTGKQAISVQKRLLEAATAIPGVTAAASADAVPFQGGGVGSSITTGLRSLLTATGCLPRRPFWSRRVI
jgi:hypothetical protein